MKTSDYLAQIEARERAIRVIRIERIGHTGRAFRCYSETGSFDIRTQSSRRFLVVNPSGHWVEKRSDNLDVARREARRGSLYFIIDTREGEIVR